MTSIVQSNSLRFREINENSYASNGGLKCIAFTVMILGIGILIINSKELLTNSYLGPNGILAIGGSITLIATISLVYVSTRKLFSQKISYFKDYAHKENSIPADDKGKNLDFAWSNKLGIGYVARDENESSNAFRTSLGKFENEYPDAFEKATNLKDAFRIFVDKIQELKDLEKPEISMSIAQVIPLKDRVILMTAQKGITRLFAEKNKKLRDLAKTDKSIKSLKFRCYDITGTDRIVGLSSGFCQTLTFEDVEKTVTSNSSSELFKELVGSSVSSRLSGHNRKSVSGSPIKRDNQDMSFFVIGNFI